MAAASAMEVISAANDLLAAHHALVAQVRRSQQFNRRQLRALSSPPRELLSLPLVSSPAPSPSPPLDDSRPASPEQRPQPSARTDLTPAKRARVAKYTNYVPEEETIRNDYSQRYMDSGEWPQNWVLGAEPEHRFEEYPKQQRLLSLKKASVANHSLPPSYLKSSDLESIHPCKFDVILLDPPFSSSFTWDDLQDLPVPTLAGDPSFVFLWVGSGSGEGLERGREVLARWGYRRCEDVVWVKTNKTSNKGPGTDPPTTSLLTRTKQHCLIGIRGTVRRSTDSWFVHCNVDTDVIFWEGDPSDPMRKPPEMYTLVENFCLGIRRLEIFGRPSSFRRGWVTVLAPGQEERLPTLMDSMGTVNVEGEEGGRGTKWDKESWEEGIKDLSNGGKTVVPMTAEIDALRPKSPIRANQANSVGPVLPVTVGPTPPTNISSARFAPGNRQGFVGVQGVQGPPVTQNPMIVQPLMGMAMNPMGMGVPNGVGVPMDEIMGAWNPMLGAAMGNMGGMANMPGMPPTAMSNVGHLGMPMMGPLGMGSPAPPGMFPGMNAAPMGWMDQGQYGFDAAWEGDGMMGIGVAAMGNGMGMGPMDMATAGMTMGQWPTGPGPF